MSMLSFRNQQVLAQSKEAVKGKGKNKEQAALPSVTELTPEPVAEQPTEAPTDAPVLQ